MVAQGPEDVPDLFMRWSWYGTLAFSVALLGIAAYSLATAVVGRVPDTIGALVGGAILLLLGGVLAFRSLRISIVDTAELQPAGLLVTTSKRTREISQGHVIRVRQVQRNPFRVREIPLRSWRHWIRVDVASERLTRTLFVWKQDPVGFLESLDYHGFPVQGVVRKP